MGETETTDREATEDGGAAVGLGDGRRVCWYVHDADDELVSQTC